MSDKSEDHRMLPGSHERASGPTCACGAEWSWWDGLCWTQWKERDRG